MENWVLAVGYNHEQFSETQKEWLKYDVFIRMASDMLEAIEELSKDNHYLQVAIFSEDRDFLPNLKILRGLTKAPIIVMKQHYDGTEKIAAIEAGADEYIQWPDTIQESVASGRALIRRYTELNQHSIKQLNILSQGCIFISVDYHKVFINTQEVPFPRREFDLLYLLASNPGRVFTQEQIYEQIWHGDYVPTENSLHSCLRRIRRKLESAQAPCSIQNVRGVGYCFLQDDT